VNVVVTTVAGVGVDVVLRERRGGHLALRKRRRRGQRLCDV
jgi:hypothetical protein